MQIALVRVEDTRQVRGDGKLKASLPANRSEVRRLVSFLLAILVISVPAFGQTDEVSGIDAEMREVEAKLNALREQQDEAVERYNRLEDELEKIQARANAAAQAREIAAADAFKARSAFEERARLAYKRGSHSEQAVQMLVNAESPARAGAALKALSEISLADAAAAKKASVEEARQGELEAEERDAFAQMAKVAAEVEGEVERINASVSEEERYRASLDRKKSEALARIEEQRRQEAEAARSKISGAGGRPPADIKIDSAALRIFVQTALAQLGKPYRYGGSGPDTFDCSGLIMYSLNAAGVRGIPHRADLQYFLSGVHPSRSQLKPGDLVFFSRNGSPEGISHNGIYIGDGQMVHAPHTGDVVRIASVDRNWTNLLATRLSI